MKRVILFLVTNLAVMLVLSISARILGVDRFLTSNGLNMGMLLAFAALIGFGGSFISLFMSKTMAKWSTGAQVIERPSNPDEAWLVETVGMLAGKAGLPMPEVAIYEGEPNAFATGPSKSNSLVAVSTGLLQSMDRRQVEAVLAHEVAHIANGDMVTLTLVQGVVNTFVIFLSRVVAYAIDNFISKDDEEESSGPGMAYWITSIVLEILFGVLASIVVMYFSRKREYRADAGAAALMGDRRPMVDALRALGGLEPGELPKEMAASGIAGGGMMALFSSHPPLESRIEALQSGDLSHSPHEKADPKRKAPEGEGYPSTLDPGRLQACFPL
jgi:heat shock protein HtpX